MSFADSEQCQLIGDLGSSMCFTLQIPADIDYRDVESAELWVYKQPHIMNANKHSFVVNEIEHWDTRHLMKPFAIQDTNGTGNYMLLKSYNRRTHTFQFGAHGREM